LKNWAYGAERRKKQALEFSLKRPWEFKIQLHLPRAKRDARKPVALAGNAPQPAR